MRINSHSSYILDTRDTLRRSSHESYVRFESIRDYASHLQNLLILQPSAHALQHNRRTIVKLWIIIRLQYRIFLI